MKRLMLVPLAAILGAVSLGAAAQLAVNSGNTDGYLQQGADSVLQCDTNGVSTHYFTTSTGGSNSIQLLKVFVDDIDASCDGPGELDVVLKDSGGNILWWGGTALPNSFAGGTLEAGTAVVYSGVLTTIEPQDVASVEVFIYDTGN